MELIRGLHNILPRHRGCAATIGNFDGVHLGHQRVLQMVRTEAKRLEVPACVITFEPLPGEFFASNEDTPSRLTGLREKYSQIQQQEVDQLLLLPFNRKLANTSPELFITQVLLDGLNIEHLLVGDDFKFGHNRAGDFNSLKAASLKHDFSIAQSPTHKAEGQRVSSTRVRTLLESGDLVTAAQLLGRPYAIQGRVGYGAQRGRTIGYPTANISLGRQTPPLRGVFAVAARFDSATDNSTPAIKGIANLGTKPTVDGTRLSLEVHLLDYSADLYTKLCRVEFLHKLRGEKKFASFDELKQAINNDEANAREWFASNPV